MIFVFRFSWEEILADIPMNFLFIQISLEEAFWLNFFVVENLTFKIYQVFFYSLS